MTEIEIPTQSYIDYFKSIHGAFSVCEMIALINICKQVPNKGTFAELGTHKGKSAVAAIYAFDAHHPYYLVEPEFEKDEWLAETVQNLNGAIKLIDSRIHPCYMADYSTNFIPMHEEYGFVFVDSGVHDDLVMEESKMLEDKMVQGGIIAYHDLNNQFVAVRRAYDYLLRTGKYEEIPVNWPLIFNHVREHNLEEGNVSWHEKGSEEFPKFVGAVKRK